MNRMTWVGTLFATFTIIGQAGERTRGQKQKIYINILGSTNSAARTVCSTTYIFMSLNHFIKNIHLN